MLERVIGYADPEKLTSASYTENVPIEEPGDRQANVVTSLLPGDGDLHAPVLDIDIPATLIPSSTPGHAHLYLDVALPWDKYCRLLGALHDAGIIQLGFLDHSQARHRSVVRMPWVQKHQPMTTSAPTEEPF